MRSLTTAYCLLLGGRRSSAVRQAISASVKRPARLCSSASAARRLRSSENRSHPHAGHTNSAAATSVPQLGHASKTGLLCWRAGRRDPVWSGDAQLHSAIELPRFVEGEPDDQNPDSVFETREKRRRVENPEQHDNPNGETERANRVGLCQHGRRILNGLGVLGSRCGRRHLRRPVLANSLDDERDVGCHDGGVGEKDRKRLIPPPAPAIGAFANGATDDESHGDGNDTQLIARHFEYDGPQDRTGDCRQDPEAESGDEATRGSPSVPLRFDPPAAFVAHDAAVGDEILVGQLAGAHRARDGPGETRGAWAGLGAVELELVRPDCPHEERTAQCGTLAPCATGPREYLRYPWESSINGARRKREPCSWPLGSSSSPSGASSWRHPIKWPSPLHLPKRPSTPICLPRRRTCSPY